MEVWADRLLSLLVGTQIGILIWDMVKKVVER